MLRSLKLITLFIFLNCSSTSNFVPIEQNCKLLNRDKDSVNIFVQASDISNFNLACFDDFDNHHYLNRGKYTVPRNTLIRNYGSNIKAMYLLQFCHSNNITFSIDSLGNWVAKSDNVEDDNILNYFVRQYENIKSANDEMQIFLQQEYFDSTFVNNPRKREELINKDFQRKFKFLTEYAQEFRLSKGITLSFKEIIEYEQTRAKLRLPEPISQWDKNYLADLIEETLPKYQSDNNLFNPFYKDGLVKVLYLYQNRQNSLKLSLTEKYKLINKIFTGNTKDFMLTKLLLSCRENVPSLQFNIEEYNKIIKQYLLECKTQKYKDYVNSIEDIKGETIKDKDDLLTPNREVTNLSKRIKKGKITYIDFWASWCVPCRLEMQASKALSEEYTKKGVDFLYISTDKDKDLWLSAMTKIGLPEQESFLLSGEQEQAIIKQLKLISIPRYVLLGKDGKIIDTNAFRPSDEKLKMQFDKLLSN
jgi:thiol-disulfide isomerase/thioredoxin